MKNFTRTLSLLLSILLTLGLMPRGGLELIGIAHAALVGSGTTTAANPYSVTMTVYQKDAAGTVTGVVYSNADGNVVLSEYQGNVDLFVTHDAAVNNTEISLDSGMGNTYGGLEADPRTLVFQNLFVSSAWNGFLLINQGGSTEQFLLADVAKNEGIVKLSASESGQQLIIKDVRVTESSNPQYYPQPIPSPNGDMYLEIPTENNFQLQVNAAPAASTGIYRAFRTQVSLGTTDAGKLTSLPLTVESRQWKAIQATITAQDDQGALSAGDIVRLKRSFYPSDNSNPFIFEYVKPDYVYTNATLNTGTSTSAIDYGTPVTYYLDDAAASSYEMVVQIDKSVTSPNPLKESIVASSGALVPGMTTPFVFNIRTSDLIGMSVKPLNGANQQGGAPFLTGMGLCGNWNWGAPPTRLNCQIFDQGMHGYEVEMSKLNDDFGTFTSAKTIYFPSDFKPDNFSYILSNSGTSENITEMMFNKNREDIATLIDDARKNGSTRFDLPIGGLLDDVKIDYDAGNHRIFPYLKNQSNDRMVYFYNSSSALPVFEVVENAGDAASELRKTYTDVQPEHVLQANTMLENVQVNFKGFQKDAGSQPAAGDLMTADKALPWQTKFPLVVRLKPVDNVQSGELAHQPVYTENQTSHQIFRFETDLNGEAAVTKLSDGTWNLKTVPADSPSTTNTTVPQFSQLPLIPTMLETATFVQVAQAIATWPAAGTGAAVDLKVVHLHVNASDQDQPFGIVDIVSFAAKVGNSDWDINQDGRVLDMEDIKYLLKYIRPRFILTSPVVTQ